jgi:hypothetical protein
MTADLPPYDAQQFSNTFNTDLGRGIWAFLHEQDNLIRMETASYLGRPAVEPLSPGLEARFGAPAFEDRVKQMTGHMIRQIMERAGLRLDQSGVRITTTGNRFSSGTRYRVVQLYQGGVWGHAVETSNPTGQSGLSRLMSEAEAQAEVEIRRELAPIDSGQ